MSSLQPHASDTRDKSSSRKLTGPGLSLRHSARNALAVIVAAIAIALMPATTLASTPVDWTQFRESQTHQGNNPETGTALTMTSVSSLSVAWTGTTTANQAVDSSPATTGGVVYVGSSDGNLYAFAVGCSSLGGACTPIWKGATGGAITSSPAVAGGDVFVGSADGKLYAFKVGCGTGGATCTPLWTATTGGAIDSSPSVEPVRPLHRVERRQAVRLRHPWPDRLRRHAQGLHSYLERDYGRGHSLLSGRD